MQSKQNIFVFVTLIGLHNVHQHRQTAIWVWNGTLFTIQSNPNK